jgi:hypothetical protein
MRKKRLSKTFRSGGKLAIRMPTESSVALQMVRFTASHVGSCVLVRACSSTVLKIEHTVALLIELVYIFAQKVAVDLHKSKTEHNPQTQLCTFRQLDCREIEYRCHDIDDVCDDVCDSLQVRENQRSLVPAGTLRGAIPVSLEWRA